MLPVESRILAADCGLSTGPIKTKNTRSDRRLPLQRLAGGRDSVTARTYRKSGSFARDICNAISRPSRGKGGKQEFFAPSAAADLKADLSYRPRVRGNLRNCRKSRRGNALQSDHFRLTRSRAYACGYGLNDLAGHPFPPRGFLAVESQREALGTAAGFDEFGERRLVGRVAAGD